MHWPLRASEVGVGLVSESAGGAVAADGSEVEAAVLQAELGSDAEAVRSPASWASELSVEEVLMVLEGLGVVQCPLISPGSGTQNRDLIIEETYNKQFEHCYSSDLGSARF